VALDFGEFFEARVDLSEDILNAHQIVVVGSVEILSR